MDLETLAELLKKKRDRMRGLFAKVKAEWETLATLEALAPYGPALRPNGFKASP